VWGRARVTIACVLHMQCYAPFCLLYDYDIGLLICGYAMFVIRESGVAKGIMQGQSPRRTG